MRRALILITVLSVVAFGGGFWLDCLQRDTAQGYLDRLDTLRPLIEQASWREARTEEAYIHALWQHDMHWLNALISHHHTRDVTTALLHLSTALEHEWQPRALHALDEALDAMGDIHSAEFLMWENVL